MLTIPVVVSDDELKIMSEPGNGFIEYLPRIKELANTGLQVEEDELFALALHYEQEDKDGWRTLVELMQYLPNRRERFDQYVDTNSSNIRLLRHPTHDISEYMGIGASLAAANKVFNIMSSDYRKIPVTPKEK